MSYFNANNVGTYLFFGSDEAIAAANSRADFIARCFPEIDARDVAEVASWSQSYAQGLDRAAMLATPPRTPEQRKLARKLGLNAKGIPAYDTDGKGGLIAPLHSMVKAALIALHSEEAAKLDQA